MKCLTTNINNNTTWYCPIIQTDGCIRILFTYYSNEMGHLGNGTPPDWHIWPLRIGKIRTPPICEPWFTGFVITTLPDWQNRTSSNWEPSILTKLTFFGLTNQDASELGPLRIGKNRTPPNWVRPSGLAKMSLLDWPFTVNISELIMQNH